MDEAIINNINSRVTNKDRLFILGDSVWGHQNYRDVFTRINGQKFIILGNHDNEQCYKKLQIDGIISGTYKIKNITIDNQFIVLCHFPMRSWDRSFHGSWMLYGHTHNTIPDYGLSVDVGVDRWNYNPVSFEELKEFFKDRQKHYYPDARDNFNQYYTRFEKHFSEKYKERVNKETDRLIKLIGEDNA